MTSWPQHQADQCIAEWRNGCSFSIIANRMGSRNRNEVAGFLARRGYHRAKPSIALKPKPPVRIPRAISKLQATRNAIQQASNEFDRGRVPLPLLDLASDGCKYPLGERGNHIFCNQRCVVGVPYCKFHCDIVYQPARR